MANLLTSLPGGKYVDRAAVSLAGTVMRSSFEALAEQKSSALVALDEQLGLRTTLLGDAVLRPLRSLLGARLRACLESEVAEDFLAILLRAMQVAFIFDHEFRRNLSGFTGRYQFLTPDGAVTVSAVFEHSCMRVCERAIRNAHLTLTFSSGRALLDYLLNPSGDVLSSVLRHEVEPEGNLNYLYKFGYMARYLQRAVGAA